MPRAYEIASYLLQKAVGVVFLIAFASFGVQALGLIGSGGLLPAAGYLTAARAELGTAAYWRLPTLLWLNSSDAMIRAVWVAGAILAVAIVAGALPRVALSACVVLYLSIMSAGQSFMAFQWDFLLLEAGTLAIFLDGSRIRAWLMQWLLFRLMFLSGLVKLASGDATWRSLTALRYHYETQPLPTPVAWYMHQLPNWFQSASVVFVFMVEILAPVLLFAGRRIRPWAAGVIVVLQVLIALTGNYTFFNYLTMALCLIALDDAWWPERVRSVVAKRAANRFRVRWPRARVCVSVVLLAIIIPISVLVASQELALGVPFGGSRLLELIAPFGLVNAYGLFANMTTTRPEIVIEASSDGQTWLPYEFRFKPGDPKREPRFVAPYQPRLDWQMWFAALGTYQDNPFFVNLILRLLQARPEVLALLESSPFGRNPPRYIRASLYEYKFTDWTTYTPTRAWWTRERKGFYFPAVRAR